MKPYYSKAATLLFGALMVAFLGACSKTSNDSTPAAAATPGTCTISWDGTYRDQYGRSCSASNLNYGAGYGCTSYTYNPSQPYCGSQYTLPPTGYGTYGGSTYYMGGGTDGCYQWTQYYQMQGYNVWYVPVNL